MKSFLHHAFAPPALGFFALSGGIAAADIPYTLNVLNQQVRVITSASTSNAPTGLLEHDTGWVKNVIDPLDPAILLTKASDGVLAVGDTSQGQSSAQGIGGIRVAWDVDKQLRAFTFTGHGEQHADASVTAKVYAPISPPIYYSLSARASAQAYGYQQVQYEGNFAYYHTANVSGASAYDFVYSSISGQSASNGRVFNSGFLSGKSSFTINSQVSGSAYAANGNEIFFKQDIVESSFDYRLVLIPLPYRPQQGLTEANALLTSLRSPLDSPTGLKPTGNFYLFENGLSGQWFDPPTNTSLYYHTVGESHFGAIRAPSSAGNLILSSEDGQTIYDADFSAGEIFEFGTPVSGFKISGFSEDVQVDQPGAFPLQVFFTDAIGSFALSSSPLVLDDLPIVSVPEPSSFSLSGAAVLSGAAFLSRNRRGSRARMTRL